MNSQRNIIRIILVAYRHLEDLSYTCMTRIGSVNDRLHFLLLERDDEAIEDREGLLALLNARIDEAKWVWPDIEGAPDEFARYIGERIPVDSKISDALRRMKISDLYLAWGCASGDEAALNAFTIHFDDMVSRWARE